MHMFVFFLLLTGLAKWVIAHHLGSRDTHFLACTSPPAQETEDVMEACQADRVVCRGVDVQVSSLTHGIRKSKLQQSQPYPSRRRISVIEVFVHLFVSCEGVVNYVLAYFLVAHVRQTLAKHIYVP